LKKTVTIYTDGACIGNPGPGGYGAILVAGGHKRELSGGFRRTTNNRMELMAAIAALQTLAEPSSVRLVSDSKYLVEAMNLGWARHWQARHWRKTGRGKALNPDLWQRLLDLCDRHSVQFEWVEGHSGHTENERCDQLSVRAAGQPNLPPDAGFESSEDAKAQQARLF
jgi:ribonuclease HI